MIGAITSNAFIGSVNGVSERHFFIFRENVTRGVKKEKIYRKKTSRTFGWMIDNNANVRMCGRINHCLIISETSIFIPKCVISFQASPAYITEEQSLSCVCNIGTQQGNFQNVDYNNLDILSTTSQFCTIYKNF
jgi:hypothetical protein